MNRERFRFPFITLLAIVVLILGSSLLYSWTDLRIVSSTILDSRFTGDAYLEMIVQWEAPSLAARALSRLIKFGDLEWRDESGQFTYTGELYAVVTHDIEANTLFSLESNERVLIPATGTRLSECGLFATNLAPGKRIYLYYGVSYSGTDARTTMTGPYIMELTYSVLGFTRRVSHVAESPTSQQHP